MSLKDFIRNKKQQINSHWLIDNLDEEILITKKKLLQFCIKDDEHLFISKISNAKIPFETLNRHDKRLLKDKAVVKELLETSKSEWYLMKTKNFKKALFFVGGSCLTRDFKKYYTDLEDIVRQYIILQIENEESLLKEVDLISRTSEYVLNKYDHICESKLRKILDK